MAMGAAEAANCAREQGKFWDFHDKLFANQKAMAPEQLKEYAVELGLDPEQFNACFEGGKYQDVIQQDLADGQRLGVTGTPAFFVNGRFLNGAQPFNAFKQVIDEELARN